MDVDLNKMKVFLAVLDADGISGAARELGLTRSAVSQSVSSLERSLGLQLFNRLGRRLVLTAEGRLLGRQFRHHQDQLRETLDEITRGQQEVRGLIRLGVFVGASRSRLARLVRSFLAKNEHAQVKLLYGSQRELTQMLLDGRLDYSVVIEPSADTASKLTATRLYEQELVLVSRENSIRGSALLAQVRDLPVVDYYQSAPLIDRWLRHHFGRKASASNVRAWAASTDLVLELVLEGAGAGVVPRHIANSLLKDGHLHLIRSGKAELQDAIWLEEPAGAFRSAALRAFRESLLDGFGNT
ncbi:MAG: LysR family transcriptional regulator [bacterium]|nr:LysR family transcriptional regulator [bacterium]